MASPEDQHIELFSKLDFEAKNGADWDPVPSPADRGRDRVGFQKSVTAAEQGLHAARSYSLIKPSRTGWHVIRS